MLFYNIVIIHLLKLCHKFQCSDVFQWNVVLNNMKNCEMSFHFFWALYICNRVQKCNVVEWEIGCPLIKVKYHDTGSFTKFLAFAADTSTISPLTQLHGFYSDYGLLSRSNDIIKLVYQTESFFFFYNSSDFTLFPKVEFMFYCALSAL